MKNKIFKSIISAILIGVFCLAFSSCKKKSNPVSMPTAMDVYKFDGDKILGLINTDRIYLSLQLPAFNGTTQLVEVGSCAFENTLTLESVEIPEGIQFISEYAFSACMALKTVSFPSTLTYLGDGVFSECAITSITLPKTLVEIGKNAFEGCPLGEIKFLGTVSEWNKIYCQTDWSVFDCLVEITCTDGTVSTLLTDSPF